MEGWLQLGCRRDVVVAPELVLALALRDDRVDWLDVGDVVLGSVVVVLLRLLLLHDGRQSEAFEKEEDLSLRQVADDLHDEFGQS